MAGGFKIECREAPGSVHVVPSGELDLATVPALDAVLEAEQAREGVAVVLDLRELSFLDSTGIHCLLTAEERARRQGTELAIVRGARQVDHVLEVAGVKRYLPIVDEPPA